MKYEYNNIHTEPNLATYDIDEILISGIHYDVLNGDMVDKSIDGCTWHEDTELLYIVFENVLSSEDKIKLDTIVINNA